jgi:hypothetical protein
MTTNITEYVNVRKKVADLGCRYPDGLALFPVNFESASSVTEFRQASEAATIRKLLIAEGLPLDDIVDRSLRPPYIKNKWDGWFAPIVFISAALYSQNPALVSLALNVLANYATEFFKGESNIREVRLDVVVEKKKSETYKRISYYGPAVGLKDLPEIIREVIND